MFRSTLVVGSLFYLGAAAAAPTAAVVFNFKEPSGEYPFAGLLEHGRAYFTTTTSGGLPDCQGLVRFGRCGTVIRLLPPDAQSTAWRAKDLYRFQSGQDASIPYGGVSAGQKGNLFLTTTLGGTLGQGALVELSPPTGGAKAWTEVIIHNFDLSSDGAFPGDRPYVDVSGNLFVATPNGGAQGTGYGSVVEFSPPAAGQTAWTENILHVFGTSNYDGAIPTSGLRPDKLGNLYLTTLGGGTAQYGTVTELSPPSNGGSVWTESVLYNFQNGTDGGLPESGVIADNHGNLFGTTYQGGTAGQGVVYELSPPSGGSPWTETTLYSFTDVAAGGPSRGIAMDAVGNLFIVVKQGGNAGFGTLVELSPPQAGQTTWTETTLHTFPGGAGGEFPAAITVEDNGNFLIPTSRGGQYEGGALVEVTNTGYVMK